MKYLSIIATLTLTLVMLLLPLLITAKMFPLYQWQFAQNNTYAVFGSKELTEAKGQEIVQFIDGKIQSLDTQFFSQQAIIHMEDVKKLFFIAKICVVVCTFLFFLFLWFALIHQKVTILASTLQWGGVVTMMLLLSLSGGVLFFWDTFFTTFHTTFFSNDLWLFPASDSLVNLFPEPFFIVLSSLAIGGSLVISSICTITGLLLKKINAVEYTKSTDNKEKHHG